MKIKKYGFSLVELLVALSILGIIILAIGNLFGNSIGTSRTVITSSQVQQELRIAANIIGDEIQRAVYIFPPNTSTISTAESTTIAVDWSIIKLGTSNFKTGPHESTEWTITNPATTTAPPMLAMIVAPINPEIACRVTDTGALVQDGNGCYKFVAYYPVLRPKVTRGLLTNSTTSNALLDENSIDSGRWVLMEFRMNLDTATGVVPWNRVGCNKRGSGSACSDPPTIDPIRANPQLPVLTCTIRCGTGNPKSTEVQDFKTKMNATVDWINLNSTGVTPQILIEGLDESFSSSGPGFQVRMPAETRDARGVFEVRLMLRGRVGDKIYGISGGGPIAFYFTPRNIAPLKAGITP